MVSKPALRETGNIRSWFFPIWDIYTDVLMSDGYAGHALNNQDATPSVTYLTHFLSIHYAPGTVLSPGDTEVTKKPSWRGFPGGAVVENLPANAGDTGSSPGLGRSHMPWSN